MRRLALLLVLLLALATSGTALAVPASADPLPSQATWQRQNARIMTTSFAWLRDRVENAEPGERLAINLDIDNTSLATHYDPGQPVRPTLRLARLAHRLGVAVLFNTARPPSRLGAAVEELEAAGFTVDDICGKRPRVRLAKGKQACRDRFADDGWTVTLNVGNRPTDFTGSGYEKKYKLRSYGGRLT